MFWRETDKHCQSKSSFIPPANLQDMTRTNCINHSYHSYFIRLMTLLRFRITTLLRTRDAVGTLKGMVNPIPQRSLCYMTNCHIIELDVDLGFWAKAQLILPSLGAFHKHRESRIRPPQVLWVSKIMDLSWSPWTSIVDIKVSSRLNSDLSSDLIHIILNIIIFIPGVYSYIQFTRRALLCNE